MNSAESHIKLRRLMLSSLSALCLLLAPYVIFAQAPAVPKRALSPEAFSDSLLHVFSLDELAAFKQFYNGEIRILNQENGLLRDKEIVASEKLYAINPDSPFMDKVLVRLAEFSYQKAEDDHFQAMERYEEAFAAFEAGERSDIPNEPKPDYSSTIAAYQLIIENIPESELLEEALFQLAFTLERNYETEQAVAYYERLAADFGESRYAPEALIRLGEYHFDPMHRDLDKAIQSYKQATRYKNTPRYNEALYKLGWSYYSKDQYASAIHAFTLLIEDIEKYQKIDRESQVTNPSLKNEALEYIGVCFRDYGGLQEALAYVDSIGRPEYGQDILIKLADIYREHEENYIEATLAYQAILQRYPLSLHAPEIQEKIVACAHGLEDPQEVVLAQQQLFDTYGPGSAWRSQIQQLDISEFEQLQVLRQADRISEEAQRKNINLLISLGEEKGDSSYYGLAVQETRKYLKSFPLDTSAYAIHWNMALMYDTKLGLKDSAYTAYLDVSNNYLQDEYRRQAAENAIVIARELVLPGAMVSSDSALAEASDVLQPGETQLVEAYNNFVQHYPEDEITAEVLGNVGSMYYNARRFDFALRYFNTLSARFPDNPHASKAQFSALESYFGKKDYGSAESMAKKMQHNDELPPELKAKVSRRLAESIYLSAEALAGQGDHLQSAQRFREVYDEVPDAEFADKAIFQAGLQFDLAKSFDQAILAYQELIASFPETEHYLDAVNNLALDYGELKDFQQAAVTYEKLSSIHSDSAAAQDALYNASHFFSQAQSWTDAIRVNRAYVTRFPQASDAEDMFYNMAEFNLQLDNIGEANRIYGEFTTRFPDSPRSVETHYKRAKYFMGKQQIVDALQEFDLTVARNKALKQKNLPGNDFYAAEALFAKTEYEFKQYQDLRFTLANLQTAPEQKRSRLRQLERQYTDVAAYGTVRLYEATHRIGQLYEGFADSWSNQELPSLSQTEKVIHLKKLNEESARLYDRAFASYKSGFKALKKLADAYAPEQPQEADGLRVVAEDSTLRVANHWVNLSGEKISEMLYKMADLNTGSIDQFLNAPIPDGMDAITELEYRNQILAKGVFPVVSQVTGDFIRSLTEADSLALENQWVAKSRTRLFDVMSLVSQEYKRLCLDAYATYSRDFDRYVYIMTQGSGEEQENSLDLAGGLVNIIELSKNYASSMERAYKISIDQVASQPFGQSIAHSLLGDLIVTTVELSGNFHESAQTSGSKKDQFTLLNQKTPKMAFEDAIYTFSDLETFLTENAVELSENTYAMSNEYAFQVPERVYLESLLVRLNPQQYAKEFDVPVDELTLTPDDSWLFATSVSDSTWHLPEFNTAGWEPVDAMSAFSENGDPILLSQQLDAAGVLDSTAVDSGAVAALPRTARTYFLRREIDLDEAPLSASLKLNADDNVKVFVNGVLVFEEQDSTLGWGTVFETDLTQFLRSGANLVAIELADTDGSGHGIQPVFAVSSVDYATLSLREEEVTPNQQPGGVATTDELIFIRHFVPKE